MSTKGTAQLWKNFWKENVVKINWINCHILQINPEFRNVFVNKPAIVFKRNRDIQDLIGGHLIKNGKVDIKKWEKMAK